MDTYMGCVTGNALQRLYACSGHVASSVHACAMLALHACMHN